MHHLFRTNEILGPVLASMHNMYFLTNLVANIRKSLLDGNFIEFRDTFLGHYSSL